MNTLKVVPAGKDHLDSWNKVLISSGNPNLFQSRVWAEWFEGCMGAKAVSLAAVDKNGILKGLLLVTIEGLMGAESPSPETASIFSPDFISSGELDLRPCFHSERGFNPGTWRFCRIFKWTLP